MPAKTIPFSEYRRRYNALRTVHAFTFKFPRSEKNLTGQQKTAITRAWNKYKNLLAKIKSGDLRKIKTKTRAQFRAIAKMGIPSNRGFVLVKKQIRNVKFINDNGKIKPEFQYKVSKGKPKKYVPKYDERTGKKIPEYEYIYRELFEATPDYIFDDWLLFDDWLRNRFDHHEKRTQKIRSGDLYLMLKYARGEASVEPYDLKKALYYAYKLLTELEEKMEDAKENGEDKHYKFPYSGIILAWYEKRIRR